TTSGDIFVSAGVDYNGGNGLQPGTANGAVTTNPGGGMLSAAGTLLELNAAGGVGAALAPVLTAGPATVAIDLFGAGDAFVTHTGALSFSANLSGGDATIVSDSTVATGGPSDVS